MANIQIPEGAPLSAFDSDRNAQDCSVSTVEFAMGLDTAKLFPGNFSVQSEVDDIEDDSEIVFMPINVSCSYEINSPKPLDINKFKNHFNLRGRSKLTPTFIKNTYLMVATLSSQGSNN